MGVLRFILVIMIISSYSPSSSAQSTSEEIEINSDLMTWFSVHGQRLRPAQMKTIMRDVPDAYSEMKNAKSKYDMAQLFGYCGGFMIGYPLGTMIAGGEANIELLAAGVGVTIISLVIYGSYVKHATKAVHLYNSQLSDNTSRRISLDIGMCYNGPGLILTF